MSAYGIVRSAHGALVRASIPGIRVGDGVTIATEPPLSGRVCALEANLAAIAVHGGIGGIACGTPVRHDPSVQALDLGACALGRAIDARGLPLDGGVPLRGRRVRLALASPSPQERAPVGRALWTGVRAIDGLLAIGRGARAGIFGAPGAGKSVLLESIARGCAADAIVVGLVGERGREAQRWIEVRPAHGTIVCATSDRPAAERVRAAHVAAAHAGALRERGLHVLLMIDSLARVAAASREIALAAGETAGRGGYPPSVFADLASLVEVAGPVARGGGSITLIASVLDDGGDRDPVSDAARSLLDAHIVLSPALAGAGRFPAIDVPGSASRTMAQVASAAHLRAAACVRRALALLDRIDDARRLGIEAADPHVLKAIAAEPLMEAFLRQGPERCSHSLMLAMLDELADTLEGPYGY